MGTGLINGGQISVDANTTRFNIASGSGIIVDNTTSPGNPTYTMVTWSPFVCSIPTY
jgi:hypothetical protein